MKVLGENIVWLLSKLKDKKKKSLKSLKSESPKTA
jgi:hypothetical protein